ncbi:MAG TPA: pitrilysin family protein [Polyangiaceae bacterium]|nr:pitrilysin family protein [Polyangiaceae bacterium]
MIIDFATRLQRFALVCIGSALVASCQPTVAGHQKLKSVSLKVSPTTPAHTVDRDAWRGAIPQPAPEVPFAFPEPATFSLSNGMRVYILPRKTGPVSLSLVIAHGASEVAPRESGLASLAATMMTEATKTKNHYQLSVAAESLGSTLTGDANRDYVQLRLDTLPEDVARGIELLAETVTAPAFDRGDFERIRKQHLDDLAAERQVPARLASLVGVRATLGEQLGSPVAGRISTVRDITIEQVRQWHGSNVHAKSAALIVIGRVDPKQTLAAAERVLNRLRGKNARPPLAHTVPTQEATTVLVVDRPGSVQSALFVSQAFPKRVEPGHAAREALDNVVGGQFTSRINQNLREQHGYTYGARSLTLATRHFGLFAVTTSVETNVTAAAIVEILKELKQIQYPMPTRPIQSDELARARTGIIESLGAHLEDDHRLLGDFEQLFVFGFPTDYYPQYLSQLRQLDVAALAEQTKRLTPDRMSVVVVGDLVSLRAQLETAKLTYSTAPAAWLD